MLPPRMIKLKCSDDVVIEVDEAVAIRSGFIKRMIEDGYGDGVIPLINVDSAIACLTFICLGAEYNYIRNDIANDITLDYLHNTKAEYLSYFDAQILEEEIKSQDASEVFKYQKAEFVNVDNEMLFDLIRAVDYLDIPELLDLTRQNLFDRMERNTSIDVPWDIRQLLVRNDQWAELNELI